MQPLPDVRLTCVSNFPIATYSGMLPGALAGLYPPERMEIDLVRLCESVGARLIVGEAAGLDSERQELQMTDRPAIPFDVLSIGIGSVPRLNIQHDASSPLLAIKPMQTFLARLAAHTQHWKQTKAGKTFRAAVVGAGVAGVEISFALPKRLQMLLPGVAIEVSLVDGNAAIARGLADNARRLIEAALRDAGVDVVLGQSVQSATPDHLVLADRRQLPVDLVLWATSADPPLLLAKLDLPIDDRGFLLTQRTLQTTSGAPIFVVGDTGSIEGESTPKAGVYAVRQGPVLWDNIPRMLKGAPLREYRAQSGFMKLLSTGDRRAILSYKGMAFHAFWCWKLKDWIDGRFMDKYQDYAPMEMAADSPTGQDTPQMRCAGCGGKVGGAVLSRVLARLDIPSSPKVLVGLDQPDDAAVLAPTGDRPITVTVDFFAAPLDDPYLVGRIAALNAASDVYALGAQPTAALTLATIPVGRPRQQEQLLYELLAGSLREFREMGAVLVGGHTIEGPQVTLGFTVLAESDGPLRIKGALRPGDLLVLTKPLGTGVLLAAAMQARLRAAWRDPLLESMLLNNRLAAGLLDEFDIAGVTDVTGFGLAGHLLEMLKASGLSAQLDLADIALLPGVAELVGEGVESTLAPANRTAETQIVVSETQRRTAAYAALFDPQTSGGMLLGVSEANVRAVLARLSERSGVPACVVGRVMSSDANRSSIQIN